MSLRHTFVSTASDGPVASKLRPSNWGSTSTNYATDPTHAFSGGAQGGLLMRDTGDVEGASWITAAAGVLTCSGVGQAPAWSASPTLTGLTVTGHALISGGYVYVDNNPSAPNLFIGDDDAPSLQPGAAGNLAIGLHALHSLTTGINNTAVGWDSQMFSVGGNNNTSLGEDALKNVNTGGDNNTAVGYTAGYGITTGIRNVAIAPQALFTNQSGNSNIAIGYNALRLTTVSDGIGIGEAALQNATTGAGNTAVGRAAGFTLTDGEKNVFLGYGAGFYETGSNKLFIDNAVRSNEADGRAKALVYGVFAAAVADQSLTVNGVLKPYQVQVDGTTAAPGYSAPSDPDSGFRWLSNGVFSYVSNGTDVCSFQSTGFNVPSTGSFRCSSNGTKLTMPGDGQFNLLTNAGNVGVGLDVASDAVLKVRTRAQTGYATVDALGYRASGAAGVSFGPSAVASITVVNGIVTAIS